MSIKMYKSVVLQMAYELANLSSEGSHAIRSGQLPVLCTRDEATVLQSLLEQALAKHLSCGYTARVWIVSELPDTCRVQFHILSRRTAPEDKKYEAIK